MIITSYTGKAAEKLFKQLHQVDFLPELDAWADEDGWVYLRTLRAVGDHYELLRLDALDLNEYREE